MERNAPLTPKPAGSPRHPLALLAHAVIQVLGVIIDAEDFKCPSSTRVALRTARFALARAYNLPLPSDLASEVAVAHACAEMDGDGVQDESQDFREAHASKQVHGPRVGPRTRDVDRR